MLKPPSFLPQPPEIARKLASQLTEKLASAPQASEPALIKALLQEALTKLNLVSYSDYERLLEIHQQTRAKLTELETKLAKLEAEVTNNN